MPASARGRQLLPLSQMAEVALVAGFALGFFFAGLRAVGKRTPSPRRWRREWGPALSVELRGRRQITGRRKNEAVFSRSKNYEVAPAPGVEPGKKGRGPRTNEVDCNTMMSKAGTNAKDRIRV